MSQLYINNGDSGLVVRTKLHNNFNELYAFANVHYGSGAPGVIASARESDLYLWTTTGDSTSSVLATYAYDGANWKQLSADSNADIPGTKASHGFLIGEAVLFNGVTWIRGQANAVNTSDVLGIVVEITNVDNFKVRSNGYIDNLAGLTPGINYLSPTVPGGVQATRPTNVGEIVRLVLFALTSTTAVVRILIPGADGAAGLPGSTGATGSPGADGLPGLPGADGLPGEVLPMAAGTLKGATVAGPPVDLTPAAARLILRKAKHVLTFATLPNWDLENGLFQELPGALTAFTLNIPANAATGETAFIVIENANNAVVTLGAGMKTFKGLSIIQLPSGEARLELFFTSATTAQVTWTEFSYSLAYPPP